MNGRTVLSGHLVARPSSGTAHFRCVRETYKRVKFETLSCWLVWREFVSCESKLYSYNQCLC